MRNEFFIVLMEYMRKYPSIWFLTGDLGFGGSDKIEKEFPERYINCGASEFSMMGIAAGLAMTGKIPFVYSITPFLLYRPYEFLRNYTHEHIPIKLAGSGRDKDYHQEGWSHDASDAKAVLDTLHDLKSLFPETVEDMKKGVKEMITVDEPYFISLKK